MWLQHYMYYVCLYVHVCSYDLRYKDIHVHVRTYSRAFTVHGICTTRGLYMYITSHCLLEIIQDLPLTGVSMCTECVADTYTRFSLPLLK